METREVGDKTLPSEKQDFGEETKLFVDLGGAEIIGTCFGCGGRRNFGDRVGLGKKGERGTQKGRRLGVGKKTGRGGKEKKDQHQCGIMLV